MTTPCVQYPAIDSIGRKVDTLIDAVQVLAVQKNEIEHLIKTQGDHRDWLKGHESRIQAIERRGDMVVTLDDIGRTIKEVDSRLRTVEGGPGKLAGRVIWLQLGTLFTLSSGLLIWIITK
jgi:hypothetical protein